VIITLVLLVAIFLRFIFFGSYRVQSNSMNPALIPGDYIFGLKSSYGLKVPFSNTTWFETDPRSNDLVVVRVEQIPDFKTPRRVIGVPGDKAEWINEELYINDKKIGKLPIYFKSPSKDESLDFDKKTDKKGQDYITNSVEELEKMQQRSGSFEIQPGFVFVVPDNKNLDEISGFWGLIPRKNIEAKIYLIWFSYGPLLDTGSKKNEGYFVRWSRVFKFVN